MANLPISGLSAGSAVADTDLFPDVQTVGVGPVKVTGLQIKTYTSTSPTLVTPTLGVASGTSLTLSTPLGVASGGTGLTSLTAGYIPFGNGTGAFGNSSSLFWDSANSRDRKSTRLNSSHSQQSRMPSSA